MAVPIPESTSANLAGGWFNTTPLKNWMKAGNLTYQDAYGILGSGAYQLLQPDIFNPAYSILRDTAFTTDVGMTQPYIDMFKTPYQTAGQQIGVNSRNKFDYEIAALQEYKKQFSGLSGTWIRWLFDNRVKDLNYQKARMQAGQRSAYAAQQSQREKQVGEAEAAGYQFSPEWLKNYGLRTDVTGTDRISTAEQATRERLAEHKAVPKPKYTPIPTPEWMQPYIEQGLPYQNIDMTPAGQQSTGRASRRARYGNEVPAVPTGAGQLRPMGAQANLTPEEMEAMGGYQAWGRAGFPTNAGSVMSPSGLEGFQSVIEQMSDWQRWWQPYTELSKKLFPTAVKTTGRWMPAQQR